MLNAKQEHCYLEMIALLAGEQFMYRMIQENGLHFGDTAPKPKKIDMTLLKMSESLKD